MYIMEVIPAGAVKVPGGSPVMKFLFWVMQQVLKIRISFFRDRV
jgi:hypothetical protein